MRFTAAAVRAEIVCLILKVGLAGLYLKIAKRLGVSWFVG